MNRDPRALSIGLTSRFLRTALVIVFVGAVMGAIPASQAFAQAEPFVANWERAFGGVGTDLTRDLAVDSHGNLIVATSLAGLGEFVIKFDGSGTESWRVRLGDATVVGYGVACDAGDNVIAIGRFTGTMVIDADTLRSAGGNDIFLASWGADGSYRWSRRFGSAWNDTGGDVTADAAGNIVITGSFTDTIDFGGGPLTADLSDCFVARFDASVAHVWSVLYQRSVGIYDEGIGIATDDAGNAYVAVNSFHVFDPGDPYPVITSYYAELLRYDAAGGLEWWKNASGAQSEVFQLVVDPFGDVMVLGDNLDCSADYKERCFGFVTKYNAAGVVAWTWMSTQQDRIRGIAADADGNVVVGGYSAGGGSPDCGQARLFGLDRGGTQRWIRTVGGSGCAGFERVGVDAPGDLLLAGMFSGQMVLSDTTYVSAGNRDVFLAKGPQPVSYEIGAITDVANDQGLFVRVPFTRANRDVAGAHRATLEYEILLRDDALPRGNDARSTNGAANWLVVGVVPATGSDTYEAVVPTMADSSQVHGMHYSVYKVRATTSDLAVFDESAPDSGYSVDHIRPTPPVDLAYSAGLLRWSASPDPDVDHYSVWGSFLSQLDASAVFIGDVASPSIDVSGSPRAYYFVRAVDDAGNTSAASSVAGVAPPPPSNLQLRSGVLSWNAVADPDVDHYDVYGSADAAFDPGDDHIERTTRTSLDVHGLAHPYYAVTATDAVGNTSAAALVKVDGRLAYPLALTAFPNPFNPNTTVRFDVPTSGRATVTVFSLAGEFVATLFDGERDVGSYAFPWNGESATGDPLSSGIYFVRLTHTSGTRTLKVVLIR